VLWLALRYIGRGLVWIERAEIARQKAEAAEERKRKSAATQARQAAQAPEGVPPHHVAAIAAAVATYGYRVVHIAEDASGRAWAAEGRWMHQTSHRRR
jgi:hypothetical protein